MAFICLHCQYVSIFSAGKYKFENRRATVGSIFNLHVKALSPAPIIITQNLKACLTSHHYFFSYFTLSYTSIHLFPFPNDSPFPTFLCPKVLFWGSISKFLSFLGLSRSVLHSGKQTHRHTNLYLSYIL